MEAMTPIHSRWDEFLERMEGSEGCDFTQTIPGDSLSVTWKCDGTMDRPVARKILESMGDIDIEGSLQYFDNHGGYCDCEILFNVF